jgi:hypothetical protein
MANPKNQIEEDYFLWSEKNGIYSEKKAWAKLDRPEIMIWLAEKSGFKLDPSKLRLFACDCVEAMLLAFEEKFPEEGRPRLAVDTARKFSNGEATLRELAAARKGAERASQDKARGSSEAESWAIRAADDAPALAAMNVAQLEVNALLIAGSAAVAAARAAGRRARAAFGTDGKRAMSYAWNKANEWQAERLRFYFKNPFESTS